LTKIEEDYGEHMVSAMAKRLEPTKKSDRIIIQQLLGRKLDYYE
jgi:hypothetical protein